MRLLLDTHILVRAAMGEARVPREALHLMRDRTNELLFSAASIWEIAIKTAQGRADFQVDPRLLRRALLDNGYAELPVNGDHAAAVGDLPVTHKDPFDRILIAQARVEGLMLLTADKDIARYPGPIRLVG
jgi:PIN domain nuclease of toxin-antitoxin system